MFNLGHRNHELVATLVDALQTLDIGNHHFPSTERAALPPRLVDLTPGLRYPVFASGRLVGNFPQAFTHVALVNSALNLAHGERPVEQRSQPEREERISPVTAEA